MALSQLLDLKDAFNKSSGVVIDVEGYDFVIVQIKTPSSTISFTTTNNGGSVIDSPATATDFIAFMALNLSTQTGVTSLAADGIVRFERGGKYLKLSGTSATVAQLFVRLYKLS